MPTDICRRSGQGLGRSQIWNKCFQWKHMFLDQIFSRMPNICFVRACSGLGKTRFNKMSSINLVFFTILSPTITTLLDVTWDWNGNLFSDITLNVLHNVYSVFYIFKKWIKCVGKTGRGGTRNVPFHPLHQSGGHILLRIRKPLPFCSLIKSLHMFGLEAIPLFVCYVCFMKKVFQKRQMRHACRRSKTRRWENWDRRDYLGLLSEQRQTADSSRTGSATRLKGFRHYQIGWCPFI